MRTLERNCGPRSNTVTSASGAASAQVMAAKNPAAPPPTTMTRREFIHAKLHKPRGVAKLSRGERRICAFCSRMSDTSAPTPTPTPHRRRPRYSGRNPRRFEEKYKEHNPQRYAETVAKVRSEEHTSELQ